MYCDIDLNHENANYGFRNILNPIIDLTDEDKWKMTKAFESLSYYYKNALLVKLETIEKYGGRNNMDPQKAGVIREYLFGEKNGVLLEKVEYVASPAPTANEEMSSPVEEDDYRKREYLSLEELNKLIGLDNVKLEVKKLTALTEMARLRKQFKLKSQKQSLHMMFKGNPGTGKTTVARLLGKILYEGGVLSIGHVIELDRSNLISKYQGEIEQKIMQYAEQAKGGILFIDEIYSLHQDGDPSDQGKQGIEVLLKVIEDRRDDFICIGAGYVNEVNQFLGSNPGLLSRFSIHIDFEDYTDDQLLAIAVKMFGERDYLMDPDFKELFVKCIQEEREKDNFANARMVRNIVESAIREQSLRLFTSEKEITEEDLMTITGDDFKYKPVKIS